VESVTTVADHVGLTASAKPVASVETKRRLLVMPLAVAGSGAFGSILSFMLRV
jgi:hypothetical protein